MGVDYVAEMRGLIVAVLDGLTGNSKTQKRKTTRHGGNHRKPTTSLTNPVSAVNPSAAKTTAKKTSDSILKTQVEVKAKRRASCLVDQATGERFDLKKGTIWIGRDEINDICLTADESVDRSHAVITHSAGEFWIMNRAEGRLTILNGQAVLSKTAIGEGDILRVGSTVLRAE